MPTYSVRLDGTEIAQVDAADTQAALPQAYALREWGPRDAMSLLLLPPGAGPRMHILFDLTNGRALARHESHRALTALHYIQFANIDALVVRCGFNRNYSVLSHEQVRNAMHYAGRPLPEDMGYADMLKALRDTLENAPWLLLPFSKEHLESQAYSIDKSDTRPMAYNPQGDVPVVTDRWTCEPQRGVKRGESTFWVDYSSGRPSGLSSGAALPASNDGATVAKRVTPPTTNSTTSEVSTMATKKAPAKKAAKKVAAKKTAPAKKAAAKKAVPAKKAAKTASSADMKNGVRRPKSGGNTGHVWDALDALKAKKGSAPSFAELDAVIEKKHADIPTATRRSNYAFWRKYHGITGRIV